MAKQKDEKTNVMRVLEQKKIRNTPHQYPCPDGAVDGVEVARLLGQNPDTVFKTLVTRGAGKGYYVFVVPVARTLDLKAAARAVGEKHTQGFFDYRAYVSDYTPERVEELTGISAQELETMVVSGGRIGTQVELSPGDLAACTGARFAPVSRAEQE